MRVRSMVPCLLLCVLATGCAPEKKCSGVLYYDPASYSCLPCPKNSTFKDGTCECKDQYEFVNNRCELKDGAVIEMPDAGMSAADSSMAGASGSCADYCGFANECIGRNTIASTALKEVVSGLHADDTAACTSNCESVLGADASKDPVISCFGAGRATAMCAGNDTQDGLANAFALVGECCGTRKSNALCKSICSALKSNSIVASMVDFCD